MDEQLLENERQHSHTTRRKERSDCVMDKKDYHDKMDTCLQQTDLHTLQRKLVKLKQSTFDATTGCSVEFNSHLNCMNYRSYRNLAYLCGLFIALFCGFPTYQLSKYTTNVLMKPLTYEFRHSLQSTENSIDVMNTLQIPDDLKLVFLT